MSTLNGKNALVTGGTRGIGAAIVWALARQGATVVLCARQQDKVDDFVARLKAEGLSAHGVAADTTKKEDIGALVDFALAKVGRIDVLVNNAGRPGGGAIKDLTDELWESVLHTNLTSVFQLTREVLRRGGMLENQWGRVINIASTGGKQGVVMATPYSASKHGVVGFTKALGLELARTGVTVNAVCPGFVETDMAKVVRDKYAAIWKCTADDVLNKFEERIPTGRYVEPNEVAHMVQFLASPEARSITAQALNVCGGLGNY